MSSLLTKVDAVYEDDNISMKDFNALSPVRRAIVIDESTISSYIIMDTPMETVESNIGNLDNSVSHIAHML